MTETKRPLKVFLCHAHTDRDPVRALYTRLTHDGVDAWLDKEKLLPGQDWELEIKKAVREADVVVVCLSRQFNQRGFRQKEVRLALDTAMEMPEGEIFIIPARLEESDTPESLRKWHEVDLFEQDGYEILMRSLRVRGEGIGASGHIKKTIVKNKPSKRASQSDLSINKAYVKKIKSKAPVKKKLDLQKLRIAEGIITNYPSSNHPNITREEFSLTLVNETGQNLENCFILLDELLARDNEKINEWKLISKKIFDKPFRWNKNDVSPNGKINLVNNERASFILISSVRFPALNVTENKNEYPVDYSFGFLGDEGHRLNTGLHYKLLIGIRAKDGGGKDILIGYYIDIYPHSSKGLDIQKFSRVMGHGYA